MCAFLKLALCLACLSVVVAFELNVEHVVLPGSYLSSVSDYRVVSLQNPLLSQEHSNTNRSPSSPSTGETHPRTTTRSFQVFDKSFHMELNQNNVLFRSFQVAEVDCGSTSPRITQDTPNTQCYYHGTVHSPLADADQEVPSSFGVLHGLTAVNLCHGGVEGVFHHQGETYHISPAHQHIHLTDKSNIHHSSRGSELHIITRESDMPQDIQNPQTKSDGGVVDEPTACKVQMSENDNSNSRVSQNSPPSPFHTMATQSYDFVLEITVVTDKDMYIRWSGKKTDQTDHVMSVMNLMDLVLQSSGAGVRLSVNTYILLTSNPFTITSSAEDTLSAFKTWMAAEQTDFPHDIAHLISAEDFGVLGLSYTPHPFCRDDADKKSYSLQQDWVQSSLGVSKGDPKNKARAASTGLHEVLHSIGVPHADASGCEGLDYVMYSANAENTEWSSCTLTRLDEIFAEPDNLPCSTAFRSTLEDWCGAGFYSDGSSATLRSRCQPCSTTCANCLSENECTRCPTGTYLDSTSCVASCPQGKYKYVDETQNIPVEFTLAGGTCESCSAAVTCSDGEVVVCEDFTGDGHTCQIYGEEVTRKYWGRGWRFRVPCTPLYSHIRFGRHSLNSLSSLPLSYILTL